MYVYYTFKYVCKVHFFRYIINNQYNEEANNTLNIFNFGL